MRGLVQQLEPNDPFEDRSEDAVASIRVTAVLRTAVVTVLVTAPESLTEVILILAQINIVSIVAIACVLIAIRLFGTITITILSIGLAGREPFPITIIDRALQHLRAVPCGF